MHGQVHAGMPYKFNPCMHANYPEALSHCGHGYNLTLVAQLSVINIAFYKTLASERLHRNSINGTPTTARHSREVRQRRASMLVIYNIHVIFKQRCPRI